VCPPYSSVSLELFTVAWCLALFLLSINDIQYEPYDRRKVCTVLQYVTNDLQYIAYVVQ